jgi:hypothetical protein
MWNEKQIEITRECTEVHEVAEKFIRANCYNPTIYEMLKLSWKELL